MLFRSILPDLRAAGLTDYVAAVSRFEGTSRIGNMGCIYASWMSDAPGGFRGEDIALVRRLLPFLALAVKSASLNRIAET